MLLESMILKDYGKHVEEMEEEYQIYVFCFRDYMMKLLSFLKLNM